jgi:hypothetical protein
VYRKDEFTMKKLLALFIIGGLLTTITGCPPGTTSQTKKDTAKGGTTIKETERDKGKMQPTPDKGKKDEEKKSEEKKTEEKKSGGGAKIEEKKTEEKKK